MSDKFTEISTQEKSAQLMFKHAESENALLTWILRGGGFLLMALGFGLILNPLSVFTDVIPFIGNVLGPERRSPRWWSL